MQKQQAIEYFKTYIASIKPTDSVAVLHHTDADGICSGYITHQALARLNINATPIKCTYDQLNNWESLVNKLKHYDKTICVDLSIDNTPALDKIKNLLVLDHHPAAKDREFVIKSESLVNHYYPASIMVYDLFNLVIDILDLDFVAAIGTVGDVGYKQNKSFIDAVAEKYNVPIGEDYAEGLGRASVLIAYTAMTKPSNIKLAFQILNKSKGVEEILTNKTLLDFAKPIDADKQKWIDAFEKNAERHGELAIYTITPKHKTRAHITTAIGMRHPHTTVISLSPKGNKINIGARRHDQKIAVNKLLEAGREGINESTSGGHPAASGGQITASDLEQFKKQLIRTHQDMSK